MPIDPQMLQAYRARLPKRDSDAESINDNIYASDSGGAPAAAGSPQGPIPGQPMGPMPGEPTGLLDRLYRDRLLRNENNSVPTTKGTY